MKEFTVELLAPQGPVGVTVAAHELLPVDSEAAVACAPEDWDRMDGYYIFSIPASVHKRGFTARMSAAENAAGGGRDAVVSYRRLPNGTILIFSDIPFDGTIFVRG